GNVKQEEDRENMITFSSWGTPAVRDKAAAQVRRIIIKGLPPSWGAPDKVLSLIHGGLIENVSITPSGNAHVLFCEHSACKAFYDKYPNGIVLDKERKLSVFVDMGTQVDVVSSNLSFNLSVGSTRVVRAVGVDMEITMTNLFEIASANNRRVEKIVDTFVPGCVSAGPLALDRISYDTNICSSLVSSTFVSAASTMQSVSVRLLFVVKNGNIAMFSTLLTRKFWSSSTFAPAAIHSH
ncbi:hypothetical protein P175DRAFT_0439174, partial [Aspergillus ochraceoroseus IBT 24754]